MHAKNFDCVFNCGYTSYCILKPMESDDNATVNKRLLKSISLCAEIHHSAIFKLRAKPVVYHHVRRDEEHTRTWIKLTDDLE